MPPAPPRIRGYLTFQGKGFSTGAERQFDVLCGDNPPSITGGYANWQPIARPLMRAVTVFQGYDPVQMSCDVRFGLWDEDGWHTDDTAGDQVELAIGDLEWMAGSNFRFGPSPVIYVTAPDRSGNDTPLIPEPYQGLPWVVNGLQWGTAIRNPSLRRIWQEATITLLNYQNYTQAPKRSTSERGGYFTSKAGIDTALKIAAAHSSHSPHSYREILARRIVDDPKNHGLKLRGIHQPVKHGQKVWVPAHAI